MASPITLKPTHQPVRAYYLALAQLANVGAQHDTAVRKAWHRLIDYRERVIANWEHATEAGNRSAFDLVPAMEETMLGP
jgi:hypothetical protein